ncbi:UvrD-helicase domain-containing protein [Sphingobacterium lumbrici]|uniref:UvrD-helicase domain-containing protein n=1 Tax=Sphingobacterium lumbrici TaxID=2559600 RepID=UPI00112C53E2|nr:UvrD-helicase domain-containing protein [Sphingobacterium lumbrici]
MAKIAPLKILKASAGSGKTFSLTVHYLTLLLSKENSYREILAVTFTNKATAEMKERILGVLQALAMGDDSKKINDYRKLLLAQFPACDQETLQGKAYQVYRKILHDYSHFTISTIDGFSQKVIRSFTYELNLDAGYKIEMNTNKVKQDLTVMLNQLLDERPDLLDWIIAYAEKKIANNENWNYRQQLMKLAGLIFSENFQEFDGYLNIADAKEVFNLLNKEVDATTKTFLEAFSQAITTFNTIFKNSGLGADELKGKSRNKLFSASKTNPNISKLSPTELQKIFDKFLGLIDNEDAFTDQNKDVRYDIIQQLTPVLNSIADLYRYFPNYLAYQAVQNNLYYLRLLKEMSDLLGQWRKENGSQLISDSQILLSKLGLDEHNDPTFIWEKIGNRYNYFLFDEFQDTSRIQWKNYSPLLINALGNATGELSEHLIVGDVKQSIYRWRNGDWRILLHQAEQQVADTFHLMPDHRNSFIENGALETNFRSLPNIIRLNNYLFKTIPHKLQAILNEKVLDNLTAEGKEWWRESGNDNMLINAYENSQQRIPESKLADTSKPGSIDIVYFPVTSGAWRRNQVEETSIETLCKQVGEWIGNKRYKANQIGILVRSNAQARLVIQHLMDFKNTHAIDFEVISGDALALISNDAILLLIETLKALVYNSDKHIIHRAKIAYLYHVMQHNESFNDAIWLDFKSNDIRDLNTVLPDELINNWENWQKLPLVHLVEKLIEIYDLTGSGNIHLPYILAFKDIVTSFSINGERGIIQFLDFWEEDGNRAVLPSNGKVNAIEVTTIHKSKGLAYDVVMLPFCSWDLDGMTNGDFWIQTHDTPFAQLGKVPIKYNGQVGGSIFYKQYFEEMLFNYMDALNTLYVATTRAVEHLYISAPLFKETVDKKTGEIMGFEIKNEYISDLVYQVLDHIEAPFRVENGEIHVQHPIPQEREETISSDFIALDHYPVSKELEKALEKSSKRTINNILMLEKASQYGILAHEIMSEVATENDVDTLVDKYIEEGVLSIEERPFLLNEIQQIWHHPEINKWLVGNYKIWNEASIITADGETIRPDKVFTSTEETIVLDFKFTQGDYIGHKSQVDKYTKTLHDLGYKNVKGYLYYAKSNQLVEVI